MSTSGKEGFNTSLNKVKKLRTQHGFYMFNETEFRQKSYYILLSTLSVADLHSKILDVPPGSKFFQFHAVFGKFWENRMLPPPGRLAPPPRGNPGSI